MKVLTLVVNNKLTGTETEETLASPGSQQLHEVMNCRVYPSHLHRNVTPEHYCLPSPRLAVAPCLFRSATFNHIHCYGGILKIHIITKIYTSIRCDPVYQPALTDTTKGKFKALSIDLKEPIIDLNKSGKSLGAI